MINSTYNDFVNFNDKKLKFRRLLANYSFIPFIFSNFYDVNPCAA